MPQDTTKRYRLGFIQLHNVRLGLATNSSSSHSMIFSGMLMIPHGQELINESSLSYHTITTDRQEKWAMLASYSLNKMDWEIENAQYDLTNDKACRNFQKVHKSAIADLSKEMAQHAQTHLFPDASVTELHNVLKKGLQYVDGDTEHSMVGEGVEMGIIATPPEKIIIDHNEDVLQQIQKAKEKHLRWLLDCQQSITNDQVVFFWYEEGDEEPILENMSYSVL